MQHLTLSLPPPVVTVCLNKLPYYFLRLSLRVSSSILLFHTQSCISVLLCIRLGECKTFPVYLVCLSEVKALCQNRNSSLFDTVAVCVQTLWHINEQCSPRKHDRATGLLVLIETTLSGLYQGCVYTKTTHFRIASKN